MRVINMSWYKFLWGEESPKDNARIVLIAQLDKILAEMSKTKHVPEEWFTEANKLAKNWVKTVKDQTEAKKVLMQIAQLGSQYGGCYDMFLTEKHSKKDYSVKPFTLEDVHDAMEKQIDPIKVEISRIK
jgi:hypothetical protein